MRKIIAIVLCMGMLLLAACTGNKTVTISAGAAPAGAVPAAAAATPMPKTTEKATESATPEEADKTVAEGEAEVQMHTPTYGEQVWMEADQDGFSGAIAYPSGFEKLDTELVKWAADTMKTYEKKAKAAEADKDGMKGDLYVAYNSYELNGRFVGVKELGSYTACSSGETEGLLYTVNYDSQTEKLLTINDVIAKTHQEAVAALLTEQLKKDGQEQFAGEATAMMQNFVITETGIAFLYQNGAAFYECTLSYDLILDYMALFETNTPEPTATPAPKAKPTVTEEAVCQKNGVHVRAEADTGAATLAVIQQGATLEVTKQDAGNGFTEIWYDGTIAYVRTAYLTFAASVSAPPELPTVAETGYVVGNGVHIRADASTRAKKLGSLKYGDPVEIVTPFYTENWHQILFDGQLAYISARYVEIGSQPAETPKPTTTDPEIISGPPYIEFVGTCDTNGVIIRSTTSIHSDYYGKLYSGDEVQVMESECRSGWDRVWIPVNNSNTRGYVGYVHSKYIDDWSQVVPVVQGTGGGGNPVPVVQATPTPAPVIPVIQATPVPVITSNPVPQVPHIGSGVVFGPGPQIGAGVTVNP